MKELYKDLNTTQNIICAIRWILTIIAAITIWDTWRASLVLFGVAFSFYIQEITMRALKELVKTHIK